MIEIRTGDCLDHLRMMPAQSAHTCVTSPPYFGLRDYDVDGQIGLEESPYAFVGKLVEVFREVRRVLREDGTLWLNLGDSYAGSWGAEGRRETESVEESWQGSRIVNHPRRARKCPEGLKPKDRMMIPARVALALQADGWWLRDEIVWHKPNPMPCSVSDRTTPAHEMIYLLSKSRRYFFDGEAIKEPATGRASGNRSGYTVPGQRGGVNANIGGSLHRIGPREMRNRRSVWSVSLKPYSGAHFATFPPDLIEPCILAGSPVGGTVLDPFGGAGTTALVALRNVRNAVLCELNPDYAAMAQDRVEAEMHRLEAARRERERQPDFFREATA
ncbi:DNA modification methylase [Tranquillimonas rosea]|uniref:Methyltransferase n=1 Tax=Tranquillimonas rosea TaxID=641238 RepID=A0A1H9PQ12_9RHOB|nr:site-specific DNA-methyltransferase [Tranquillimonas rosea]SER50312.1 DNA modification methylase [Tranquillimonas rosea]